MLVAKLFSEKSNHPEISSIITEPVIFLLFCIIK